MPTVNRQIWDNAWFLAQKKGWKKAEFARQLKTRPQTLNNYESGDREVGKRMRKRMADVLGVKELDLLKTGKEVNNPSTEGKEVIEALKDKLIAVYEELAAAHKRIAELEVRLAQQGQWTPGQPERRQGGGA